jgi:hydroxypyruvate isomerase
MTLGLSAHLNSLYAELDEADACSAAAKAGFQCVEMWAAPPENEAANRLIDRLEHHNLSLASVNTHQGAEPDDFGLVSEPSYVEWWRKDFLDTLGFARRAHARAINVLVGGRSRTASRTAQRRCLLDNLDWSLGQLAENDPFLLLEPLNGADRRSPLLQNTAAVLAILSELQSPPNLRLLFDAYHLFQEEDDLIRSLQHAAHAIGHVQLADYPGRAEPGTGELPVGRFLAELGRVGYNGWVGLEYFPSDKGSPLAWLREYAEFDDQMRSAVAS